MGSRLARVNEQLKEVLAVSLGGLKDPRIGFVTVTGVDTTADLSQADVWFTLLDDDAEALASTLEGLNSATPLLRHELGQQIRMRRIPELRFRHDPAPGEGRRIERLLEQTRKADEGS